MQKSLNLTTLENEITFIRNNSQNTTSPVFSFDGMSGNSLNIKPGWLFVAERGVSKDGHQFIPKAIEQGATGLVVEHLEYIPKSFTGAVIVTKNSRNLAPKIASLFFDRPSEKLFCVGITGTNGKTSLTYLVEHLLNSVNKPTGVVGTINHHLGKIVWPTEMTTPHPIELQSRLDEFVTHGAQAAALEVSSHAIDQGRINGIEFDVGVFTNLTRDHLDYHSSMEDYFTAKERFFSDSLYNSNKKDLFAVINYDDPWGQKIKTPSPITRWNYGKNSGDLTFQLIKMDFEGTIIKIKTPMGSALLKSPLIGLHNIYNVLAAVGACLAGKMTLSQIETAIPTFTGVPGRLQKVPTKNGSAVFVDYAHSPDALENVLTSLKNLQQTLVQKGRLLCVFGCGGDRDKGKRPQMAKVAETFSDFVILTSDNPRTEDPLRILDDIEKGFSKKPDVKIIRESDREKAISIALNEAQPNDVILIAGKGHEDYQIIGKEKFYFSDFDVVRKLTS